MSTLPDRFADLEPFVAEWALANERDRFHKLVETPFEALQAFYRAIAPRVGEIAEHLDAAGLDHLTREEHTLFSLLMTFVECAHPIELDWGATDLEDSYPAADFGFYDASCEPAIGR